jgi:glycosyltransferase involved in cell wall biosynthesis
MALAAAGNEVYFLNPPSETDDLSNSSFQNLFIVDYRHSTRGLNRMPLLLSNVFWKRVVRQVEKISKGKFDIVWSFDPYRFQDLDLFRTTIKIYYAADVHRHIAVERTVCNHSDIVLSPSHAILNRLQTRTFKQHLDHAVADYFLWDHQPVPLPGSQQRKIVFVGNLGSKYLNQELALETILKNQAADFIFVGDASALPLKLKEQLNVFCLGRVANSVLPSIFKSADVLWLYYDTEKYEVEASNSHKIMEYLSSGKVIVSTKIAEYTQRQLLIMTDVNDQLPQLMQDVLENLDHYNSTELQTVRIEFAKGNTYTRQLKKIEVRLSEVLKK